MATIEEIKKRFELAPDLPSGLKYKIHISHNAMAGRMAGSDGGRGYYQVQVKGRSYKTTHIIAMLADLPRWQELRQKMKDGDYTLVVDHIDRNPRNNAPANLRIISNRENLLAARTTQNSGTSKYRGVSWSTKQCRFKVTIRHPDTGRNVYLGSFKCEQEAYQVYLNKAKEFYPNDNNFIKNN